METHELVELEMLIFQDKRLQLFIISLKLGIVVDLLKDVILQDIPMFQKIHFQRIKHTAYLINLINVF